MNKIIQCPSCDTKFALNESQIAGLDNPKFHCSRCNTVFSVTENDTEAQLSDQNNTENQDQKQSEDLDKTPKVADETESELKSSETDFFEDLSSPNIKESIEEDNWKLSDTATDHESKQIKSPPAADIESKKEEPFFNSSLDSEEKQLDLFSNNKEQEDNDDEDFYKPIFEEDEDNEKSKIKVPWENTNPYSSFEANPSNLKKESDKGSTQKIQRKPANLSDSSSRSASEILNSLKEKTHTPDKPSSPSENKTSLDEKSKNNDINDTSKILRPKLTPENNFSFKSSPRPAQTKPTPQESVQKDSAKKSLNEIFDRDSKKKDDDDDNKKSPAENLEPTKVNNELISISDSTTSTESSFDDIPLRNLKSSQREEAVDEHDLNRSMKNTTVVKRDNLESQGFIMIDEDPGDASSTSTDKTNLSESIQEFSRKTNIPPKSKFNLQIPALSLNSTIQSFLVAWSLPFLMMIILFIWSGKLSERPLSKIGNDTFYSKFISILGFDKPLPFSVAPADVHVGNFYISQFLAKDTKNSWLLVRGVIINKSDIALSGVELETVFFNDSQEVISSKKGKVPNKLSLNKHEELTENELINIQKEPYGKRVPPNTSFNVTLAFKDKSNAKWFSTRIHSVEIKEA